MSDNESKKITEVKKQKMRKYINRIELNAIELNEIKQNTKIKNIDYSIFHIEY